MISIFLLQDFVFLMKIKEIELSTFEYVIMEDHTVYRRYSYGDWEIMMGQSWEPCYSDEQELEKLYKEYTRSA